MAHKNGWPTGLMKAARLHDRSGPAGVFFEDAPIPAPRPGDALVRVHATGITPAELTWSETYENADGSSRIPSIPGHEICGVLSVLDRLAGGGPEIERAARAPYVALTTIDDIYPDRPDRTDRAAAPAAGADGERG